MSAACKPMQSFIETLRLRSQQKQISSPMLIRLLAVTTLEHVAPGQPSELIDHHMFSGVGVLWFGGDRQFQGGFWVPVYLVLHE